MDLRTIVVLAAAAAAALGVVVALPEPAQAVLGPDGGGYYAITSDEPGGPAHSWTSIVGQPGTVALSLCDDCSSSASLLFTFPFYASSYTTASICEDGYVFFPGGSCSYYGYNIPSTSGTENMVAGYWSDLVQSCSGAGSGIYYQSTPSVFTVQYQAIKYWSGWCSGPNSVTLQIKLYPTGVIDVVYLATGPDSVGSYPASLGIENPTGTQGLQYKIGSVSAGTGVYESGRTVRYYKGSVFTADTATVAEDSVAHINVLANDPAGTTLTSAGSCTAKGCPALSDPHAGMPVKHIDFTPYAHANTAGGPATTFSYSASSGSGSGTATVSLTITAVNDAPSFTPGPNIAMAEDAPALTLDGWASGFAPGPATATDEATQTLSLTHSNPSPALSSVVLDLTGKLAVTPKPDGCTPAPSTSTLTLKDSGSGVFPNLNAAAKTFTLHIECSNDAPVALPDAFAVNANADWTTLNVLDNPGGDDYDPDKPYVPGEPMTITSVSAASPTGSGTAQLANPTTLQYKPPALWTGESTFEYTITDGQETDTALVEVVVGCPGLKAVPDGYALLEDQVFAVSAATGLLANDVKPEGGSLQVVLVDAPEHGEVTLSNDGSFTFLGAQDYFGADSFSYRFKDTSYCNSKAVVTLTLLPSNDSPVAVDDLVVVLEDSVDNVVPVLANDHWLPDAPETLAVTGVGPPSKGATLFTGGTILYTPPPHFFGLATFAYTITDGNEGNAGAMVTVKVEPSDDAPQAFDDAYTVDPGALAAFDSSVGLLANDVELDFEPLHATLAEAPSHGALQLFADGAFHYTPAPGYGGPDVFTYFASDGKSLSLPAVVEVFVTGNTLPTAAFSAAPASLVAGEDIRFADLSSDPDGEVVAWSWDFGDGAVAHERHPGHTFAAAGPHRVLLTVTDDRGGSATAERLLTVTESFHAEAGGANAEGLPVADAGGDRYAVQGDLVQLDGSGADGATALTWTWTQLEGPSVQLSSQSMRPTFTAPAVEAAAPLSFALTIFDGERHSLPDTVRITVVPTVDDIPRPQLVAGADQTVAPGAQVTLMATPSGFPGEARVTWQQLRGPTVGQLPDGPSTTFRVAEEGEYVFAAVADDGIVPPVSAGLRVTVDRSAAEDGFDVRRGHQPSGIVSFRTLVPGTQHRWDFGDGATGSGIEPVHAYGESGTYTVVHRVTLDDGRVQTYREAVTVHASQRVSGEAPEGTPPWLVPAGAGLAGAALAVGLWLRRRGA